MSQIRIINPGLLTTVQDMGRYGYQQYGVSVSGAMDFLSARLSNILAGNDENEGLLEMTMIGADIEFLSSTVIAITGADMQPFINNNIAPMYKSIMVSSGDVLSFKGLRKGLRCYVAFYGGIDVPIIMGSKSTFLRGKIGGFKGRPLKSGDILNIGQMNNLDFIHKEIEDNFLDLDNSTIELKVILGPQDDEFTEEGINTLFSTKFTVTNESDRMGYRLAGEKIEHKKSADIISDGISMGAIQVPSDGNPIIMMADRQTTGGYTKIGNIITTDLPKLAQAKPGDLISFTKIDLVEAHRLLLDLENKISQIKLNVNDESKTNIKEIKTFRVRVNNNYYNVQVEEMD